MTGVSSLVSDALLRPLHLQFIKNLDARIQRMDYWQAEYLRMSGIYWALTSLLLLEPALAPDSEKFGQKSPMSRQDIVAFVAACQCKNGATMVHQFLAKL